MASFDLGLDVLTYAVYVLLLVIAAIYDIAKYMIPNAISIALVSLFIIWAFTGPFYISWVKHLGAGLLLFSVGALLFRFRILGGGDVKLLAATSTWIGLDLLPLYLVLVAFLGGGLAVLLLTLRTVLRWLPLTGLPAPQSGLPRVLKAGENLPYGAAIAGGGILVAAELPFFLVAPVLIPLDEIGALLS